MLDQNLIKVKVLEETEFFGKYEMEPLERGYAQTLGNSLRRVLLSSLKGAAITSVKMNGVKHEYATIPGVEEDVLSIILNLKQLKLKSYSDEKQVIYLNVKKKGEVTAADIETSADVEILNPDLVIATLADAKNALAIEMTVETGVGYMDTDNNRVEVGLIPVDADFSPVERVNFYTGSARLGQITDLDKLTIEIFTKAIAPSKALHDALEIYANILQVIEGQVIVPEEEVIEVKAKKTVAKKKTAAKSSTKKTTKSKK